MSMTNYQIELLLSLVRAKRQEIDPYDNAHCNPDTAIARDITRLHDTEQALLATNADEYRPLSHRQF